MMELKRISFHWKIFINGKFFLKKSNHEYNLARAVGLWLLKLNKADNVAGVTFFGVKQFGYYPLYLINIFKP